MKIDGSKWWLPWKTQSGEDITAILSSMGFEIVDTLGDSCKVIPPEGWTGKLEKEMPSFHNWLSTILFPPGLLMMPYTIDKPYPQ